MGQPRNSVYSASQEIESHVYKPQRKNFHLDSVQNLKIKHMRTTKASIVGSTDLTNKPDPPESTDVDRTSPDDEALPASQKAQPKDHIPSIQYG